MSENNLSDKELRIIIHISLMEGIIFQSQIKKVGSALEEKYTKVLDRMSRAILKRIKNGTFFPNSCIPGIQSELKEIRDNYGGVFHD